MDHGGDAVSNSVSNALSFIDGESMCEMLSWLSVESLMRFKCVCKTWKVLIEEDPYFIDLHLTRSKTRPSLFIAYQKQAINCWAADGYRYKVPYQTWLMTANLPGDGAKADIQTIEMWDSLRFNTILGPLNGLVCFIDENRHHYAVCLYNVRTREVTPWILSNLLLKFADNDHATHHLGFDPNTKEHKVICIRNFERKGKNTYYDVCEILTVGDNTWRRMSAVPTRSSVIFLGSISVNGSLYWIACERSSNTKVENIQIDRTYLMVFDVGSEKFREITIPGFVVDQARAGNYPYFCRSALLEVDGNVALARIQSNNTVNLWTFQDDNKNISNTTTTMDTESWIKIRIALPFLCDENRYLDFHRGAGLADHIIFEFWEPVPNTRTNSVAHYSYNLKKKTLTKIDDVC